MKLGLVLSLSAGVCLAQNGEEMSTTTMASMMPPEEHEMEMSCLDWLEAYVPGFKHSSKNWQFKNEELDIFVKYTYDNKFQFESPWFSEEWKIKHSDDMVEFDWSSVTMNRFFSELSFKQGMEKLKKTKVKNGKEKKVTTGYQWIRETYSKTYDETTKKDSGMILFKETVTAQMDKKMRYTGYTFDQKVQFGKAWYSVDVDSKNTMEGENKDFWRSTATDYKIKAKDSCGNEMLLEGQQNTELVDFQMSEEGAGMMMAEVKYYQVDNMWSFDVNSKLNINNFNLCKLAASFMDKAVAPFEVLSVEDVVERLRWDPEMMMMSQEELEVIANDILSALVINEYGMMQMVDYCSITLENSYTDPTTTEEISQTIEFMFKNLVDMCLKYNDQEIIKVTNMMATTPGEEPKPTDFMYTVSLMGEEYYTVSPITWHQKMMSMMKLIQSELYYQYKMHETYFMEAQEWEEDDWMNLIQYLGNWDYLAAKVHEWEKGMLQAEKEKCQMSVVDMYAEWGVYLAPKGEECVLRNMDMHVQYYEWAMTNDVDMMGHMMYMAQMEFGKKHEEWGMGDVMVCEPEPPMYYEPMDYENNGSSDDGDVMPFPEPEMSYPEFIYEERDVETMRQVITVACTMYWDEWLVQHEETGTMIIGTFVMYRDMWVNQTQMMLNKVTDRAGAEAMIQAECDRMEVLKADRWSCEFDSYHRYYLNEEQIMSRMEQCAAHTDLIWFDDGILEM